MARKAKLTDTPLSVTNQAEAAIQAAMESLDMVAVEMERKWGVGRLQRLVSPEMAARFAASRERLNHTIETKDLDAINERVQNHIKGWRALDAMATAEGHPVNPAGVWTASVGGLPYTVVYNEADLPKVAQQDAKAVTLTELLLAYQSVEGDVAPVKAAFPGAKVRAIRAKKKKEIDNSIDYWGDEIP